jgi:hypothetical protein
MHINYLFFHADVNGFFMHNSDSTNFAIGFDGSDRVQNVITPVVSSRDGTPGHAPIGSAALAKRDKGPVLPLSHLTI